MERRDYTCTRKGRWPLRFMVKPPRDGQHSIWCGNEWSELGTTVYRRNDRFSQMLVALRTQPGGTLLAENCRASGTATSRASCERLYSRRRWTRARRKRWKRAWESLRYTTMVQLDWSAASATVPTTGQGISVCKCCSVFLPLWRFILLYNEPPSLVAALWTNMNNAPYGTGSVPIRSNAALLECGTVLAQCWLFGMHVCCPGPS